MSTKNTWSRGNGPAVMDQVNKEVREATKIRGRTTRQVKELRVKGNPLEKESKQFCFNFNSGGCENPKTCRYVHACSTCGERGHRAVDKRCNTWGSGGKAKDATKGKGKWTKSADKGKGNGKADKGKAWYQGHRGSWAGTPKLAESVTPRLEENLDGPVVTSAVKPVGVVTDEMQK